ncbi:5'-3' exonuclease [Jiangella alba]|uniref:5'-3' exonuclease n=1 Tax=Jiangella alba TaxID=561176 RepID=A0A1H5DR57_9ACTN|nr:5'-3' exonuclease H3TH domain-containing protein [Jiangella alba]SED81395.1 5'-3' exonuclease [Jiangella alba]
MTIDVHLVDGTYELFRYHYAPNNRDPELGATRGVVGTCLQLLEQGATHIGVATDHVIESFRNDLWPTYKDGSGVDPALKAQFPVVEEVLAAAGFTVWPLVEVEADDGMAAAALMAARDERVGRVVICTPDKDLAQCVGGKVVQWDRRRDAWFDADGVRAKFGVEPESIPDYLALVGDSADGFPGLPGWGAKATAAVLAEYRHLEHVPSDPADWTVTVRGAAKLAATLQANAADALLFRRIATVALDAPVSASVDELEWTGPSDEFAAVAGRIGGPQLAERAAALAAVRGSAPH